MTFPDQMEHVIPLLQGLLLVRLPQRSVLGTSENDSTGKCLGGVICAHVDWLVFQISIVLCFLFLFFFYYRIQTAVKDVLIVDLCLAPHNNAEQTQNRAHHVLFWSLPEKSLTCCANGMVCSQVSWLNSKAGHLDRLFPDGNDGCLHKFVMTKITRLFDL